MLSTLRGATTTSRCPARRDAAAAEVTRPEPSPESETVEPTKAGPQCVGALDAELQHGASATLRLARVHSVVRRAGRARTARRCAVRGGVRGRDGRRASDGDGAELRRQDFRCAPGRRGRERRAGGQRQLVFLDDCTLRQADAGRTPGNRG